MVRRGARFPGLQDLAKASPRGAFSASRRGEGASPGRKLTVREGRFRTSISRPDLRCPVLDYCKGPGWGPCRPVDVKHVAGEVTARQRLIGAFAEDGTRGCWL